METVEIINRKECSYSKKPNSSDTISRQAAIDTTWEDPSYTDPLNVLSEVRDRIKALSSAQQERPKGHWVEIGDEPFDEWECDMCGFVIDGSGCIDPEEYRDVYKFCPNCGADMRGKQNGQ